MLIHSCEVPTQSVSDCSYTEFVSQLTAGSSRAIRIAMTTSNSIRVNPRRCRCMNCSSTQRSGYDVCGSSSEEEHNPSPSTAHIFLTAKRSLCQRHHDSNTAFHAYSMVLSTLCHACGTTGGWSFGLVACSPGRRGISVVLRRTRNWPMASASIRGVVLGSRILKIWMRFFKL